MHKTNKILYVFSLISLSLIVCSIDNPVYGASRSKATKIGQVKRPGSPLEHELFKRRKTFEEVFEEALEERSKEIKQLQAVILEEKRIAKNQMKHSEEKRSVEEKEKKDVKEDQDLVPQEEEVAILNDPDFLQSLLRFDFLQSLLSCSDDKGAASLPALSRSYDGEEDDEVAKFLEAQREEGTSGESIQERD